MSKKSKNNSLKGVVSIIVIDNKATPYTKELVQEINNMFPGHQITSGNFNHVIKDKVKYLVVVLPDNGFGGKYNDLVSSIDYQQVFIAYKRGIDGRMCIYEVNTNFFDRTIEGIKGTTDTFQKLIQEEINCLTKKSDKMSLEELDAIEKMDAMSESSQAKPTKVIHGLDLSPEAFFRLKTKDELIKEGKYDDYKNHYLNPKYGVTEYMTRLLPLGTIISRDDKLRFGNLDEGLSYKGFSWDYHMFTNKPFPSDIVEKDKTPQTIDVSKPLRLISEAELKANDEWNDIEEEPFDEGLQEIIYAGFDLGEEFESEDGESIYITGRNVVCDDWLIPIKYVRQADSTEYTTAPPMPAISEKVKTVEKVVFKEVVVHAEVDSTSIIKYFKNKTTIHNTSVVRQCMAENLFDKYILASNLDNKHLLSAIEKRTLSSAEMFDIAKKQNILVNTALVCKLITNEVVSKKSVLSNFTYDELLAEVEARRKPSNSVAKVESYSTRIEQNKKLLMR